MIRNLFKSLLCLISLNLTYAQGLEFTEINQFGENPGNLQFKLFAPKKITKEAPLVVVLHGCLQDAQTFAIESGWLKYAQKHNFALLVPGQNKDNNAANCFNWFLSEDNKKGKGETASLYNMISHTLDNYSIDKKKVYITGFSAGASMVSVMLAHYPELFSAGAVVAGVPYGCANSTLRGLTCMAGFVNKSGKKWASYIRDNNSDEVTYPRLSIWSGNKDKIVKPANANQLLKQWLDLHYNSKRSDLVESNKQEKFHTKRSYTRDNQVIIESYSIKNYPHGQPIHTGNGESKCGSKSQYVINAGICAAYHQSKFFKLF